MSDEGDFLDEGIGFRLSRANPYDPETVDGYLPPRSGQLMLSEITSSRRRTLFGWLPGRSQGSASPAFSGRAAFVGVLAVIAAAVVGLNLELIGRSEGDVAPPEFAEGASGEGDVSPPADEPVSPTLPSPENESGAVADSSSTDTTAMTGSEDASSSEAPLPPVSESTSTTGESSTSAIEAEELTRDCLSIEAEHIELAGGWAMGYDDRVSNGEYVTWEGLLPEEHNDSPTDVIEIEIAIANPGTYRFTWAMRQPFEVSESSANSTWVNFPDAARFGPVDGGSFGGFVPVVGAATGEFDWSAAADYQGQPSQISIVFESAGTYTMQLAGRSHGHEIDRIVIYQGSVTEDDATTGRCDSVDG